MPTHSEVVRLNLEFYRKQAKALLKSAKAGDPEALRRLQLQAPKFDVPALHDAQLAIAREQGFASWPRFKAFIAESQLDFQGLLNSFIDAAVSNGRRAAEIRAAHPKIAGAGFYVALVLGDAKEVERTLEANPTLLIEKSGPQNREPLVYVCFSRFANGKSDRATALAETARALLRRGADPNTSVTPDDLPDNPLSCLYAASGLNNNPAMTLALLEAGANPNDGESLYHSTEHPDLACMKLLLQHGADPARANGLKHMLDREDLEGLQLLLAAKADPNLTNEKGETALHWAVWRGRSEETIRLLLDHGADLNAQRQDGRTAYALAVVSGQKQIAELLKSHGANTALAPIDQFVDDCTRADPSELKLLLAQRPPTDIAHSERLLPDHTRVHHTAAVRALLAMGVPVNARGEAGGTALHWACWKGYPDLVQLLIEHGASLSLEDTQFRATPSGWLHHGTQNCPDPGGRHAEALRILLAAGAPMNPAPPTGNADVDAVLREHNLLKKEVEPGK